MTNRMDYIKEYFAEQEKVKVECPVSISETNRGKLYRYFEGTRFGYQFKRGVAWVEKKDLHLFKEHYPYWVYNDGKDDK